MHMAKSYTYSEIYSMVTSIINADSKSEENKNLIDDIEDAVFWKDSGGLLVGCNNAFAKISEMDKGGIVGKSDYDFAFTQTDIKLARREDDFILSNKQPLLDLLRFKYGDWTLVSKYPMQSDGGDGYVLGIARDISRDRLYQRYDILQYLKERHFLGEVVSYGSHVAFVFRMEPSLPVQYISDNIEGLGINLNDIYPGKTNFMQFVHRDDRAVLFDTIVENGKSMGQFDTSFRLLGKEGSVVNVNCSARVLHIKTTMATVVQGTLCRSADALAGRTNWLDNWMSTLDTTQNHSATIETLKFILDRDPWKISIVDMDTYELLYSNVKPPYFDEKKAQGETICYKLLYPNRAAPCAHCPMGVVSNEDTPSKAVSMEYFDSSDNKWYYCSAYTMKWLDGQNALFMKRYDISQAKQADMLLKYNSYMDTVLNLPNRRRLEELLPTELESCPKNMKIALIAINTDDFGKINYAYGFDKGNSLLKEIANFLYEIHAPDKMVFRTSGDEFIILLKAYSMESIRQFVNAIFQRFEMPWKIHDHDISCTASMGVSIYPDNSLSAVELQKNAMAALKQAKHEGKHRVMYFKRYMAIQIEQNLRFEKKMRKAIDNNCAGFLVYYQPQIDAKTEKCVGVEALTRWVDDNECIVMPGVYIPIVESLDIIKQLDTWVLRTATTQLIDNGFLYDDNFTLSVNISALHLTKADLIESLENILNETGFPPGQLIVEVTESIAIDDIRRATSRLSELRGLGIKVAMDDFGTGFSSLYNMKNMPIDSLKIDRSFINELTVDEYSQNFVKTISELAHTMGMKVCAEGVETEAQKQILISSKSDYLQGYLFGRPMPIADLAHNI